MRLALGPRRYDLRARALVLAVLGPTDELADQGADIVELTDPTASVPVPLCMAASDEAGVGRALAAGASLVCLSRPTAGALAMCATAGVAVLVPPGAEEQAAAAGLPPERIIPSSLLLDVTADDCPVVATAVGVIRGARVVRVAGADVRAVRRVCDVLAAVMEAR